MYYESGEDTGAPSLDTTVQTSDKTRTRVSHAGMTWQESSNSSPPFDGQPERLGAEELEHHRGAEAAHGVEAKADQVASEVGAAQGYGPVGTAVQ